MSDNEKNAITNKINSKLVSLWIEDLMVKVFYGEFRIRFLCDLGQALCEGPRIIRPK